MITTITLLNKYFHSGTRRTSTVLIHTHTQHKRRWKLTGGLGRDLGRKTPAPQNLRTAGDHWQGPSSARFCCSFCWPAKRTGFSTGIAGLQNRSAALKALNSVPQVPLEAAGLESMVWKPGDPTGWARALGFRLAGMWLPLYDTARNGFCSWCGINGQAPFPQHI